MADRRLARQNGVPARLVSPCRSCRCTPCVPAMAPGSPRVVAGLSYIESSLAGSIAWIEHTPNCRRCGQGVETNVIH